MKRISSSKLPDADDRADLQMGLGKTAQVAAFLGALGRARLLRSVLIVAPATVLSHWNTELNRWAPMLRTVILHRVASAFDAAAARGTNARDMFVTHALSLRPAVACVTTYDGLRQLRGPLLAHGWCYAVLDEGHKIRNPEVGHLRRASHRVSQHQAHCMCDLQADTTVLCKQLRTIHRLIMSGTPIQVENATRLPRGRTPFHKTSHAHQNSLRELWSLFDFVFPGRLGTLTAFDSEFATPIRLGGYANARPMQVVTDMRAQHISQTPTPCPLSCLRATRPHAREQQVRLAHECAVVLRDLISPYLLRRQKRDLARIIEMPGKTEHVLFCRLTPSQRAMYQHALDSPEVRAGARVYARSALIFRDVCRWQQYSRAVRKRSEQSQRCVRYATIRILCAMT